MKFLQRSLGNEEMTIYTIKYRHRHPCRVTEIQGML